MDNLNMFENSLINSSFSRDTVSVVGLADPDYEYYLKLRVSSDGNVTFESGFTLDLLILLQFTLNFTYKAVEGEGWIDQLDNGSWTGIGRQIMEDEADLSIAQSTMLPCRVAAFSYLLPTTQGILVASFKQPPGNSMRNILTASFPLSLWIGILLAGILVLLFIKILFLVRKRQNTNLLHIAEYFFVEEAAFWILITFCQRNLQGSPSSTPMRIIYLSLVMTSLVCFVAYSASLVSNLAVQLLPIRSFADLIRSDLLILGDVSVPYTYSRLESLKNKEGHSNLLEKYIVDVHTGIRRVLRGHSSFVTFQDALNTVYKKMNMTDEYICENIFQLNVIGGEFPSGMLVKKNSPFRQLLNPKIAMFHERGFVKRLHEKWYSQFYPRCLHKRLETRDSLESSKLSDVYTLFLILLIGFAASIILIILELFSKLFKISKAS